MNMLITAGNTLVLIDRVRCLTNIFTGRTGMAIALAAHTRGHHVKILTSHPDALSDAHPPPGDSRWSLGRYRTFDDLQQAMADELGRNWVDAVIHTAAVSDYLAGGIYAPDANTQFHPGDGHWEGDSSGAKLVDRAAGKVKSDEPELWLRLVRAPKLVDQVRSTWGFRGVLVKFKLEVGISDERLLEIAERSRQQSAADLMVANTLEGSGTYAFLGPVDGRYERVARRALPPRLVETIEQMQGEVRHG